MIRLGVIGYGARCQHVINLIDKFNRGVKVVAITDIRNEQIQQEMKEKGIDSDSIQFFTDADEMLDKVQVDGVIIGTRCSLHATMAIKVLRRNMPLFLEKPVATNLEDLLRLKAEYEKSKSEVVVSFPLRVSPMVELAKEIIESGRIGIVEHVQAWNNVPYGAVYYREWYRDENETGGLLLQKATHDFDYINSLLHVKPRWIAAVTSKRIFNGDKPGGLRCNDCTEWEKCMESPLHLYYTRCEEDAVRPNNYMCQFAEDTGNEDSGSALIQYDSGMHVAYSQNFFARRGAGKRGARFFGYCGTLEFDWYTGQLKVFMHHKPRVEIHEFEGGLREHGGGDKKLAYNFIQVMEGKSKSISPLDTGLLSVLMCLKAKESAQRRSFEAIAWE